MITYLKQTWYNIPLPLLSIYISNAHNDHVPTVYDGTWNVSNIVHDVYYNHIWHIVGRRITQNGLLRRLPGFKLDIQKWAPAKCNDENYQHVVRHDFWQVWWSMNIISTQNFSKFVSTENWPRFMKVKNNLDFDEFLAEVGVGQMGIFSNWAAFDAIYQLCS